MTALAYLGPPAGAAKDIAYRAYAAGLLPGMSPTDVDAAINTYLSDKVLRSYVTSQDALLADAAYMSAGDATRVKTVDKDAANGVLALGPSGKGLASRFNVATTQRWPTGIWTPATYGVGTGVTAETLLFSFTPTGLPASTYKTLVYGTLAAQSNTRGEHPVINVRAGSTSGTIVAIGRGNTDSYLAATIGTDAFPGDGGFPINTTLWENNPISFNGCVLGGNENAPTDSRRMSHWKSTQPTGDSVTVRWTIGNTSGPPDNYGAHRIYITSDVNGTVGAAVEVNMQATTDKFIIQSANGSGPFTLTNQATFDDGAGTTINAGGQCEFSYDLASNTYNFYYNDVLKCSWHDTSNVVPHGASTNRNVSVATNATNTGFNARGPSMDNFELRDGVTSDSTAAVHLRPVNFATAPTGITALYVMAMRSGSTGAMNITNYKPSLHVVTVPV